MFKKIKKIEIMPTMYNFWNDKNKLSKKKKKIEDKILSDATEALIGAVYLDSGYKVAETFKLTI